MRRRRAGPPAADLAVLLAFLSRARRIRATTPLGLLALAVAGCGGADAATGPRPVARLVFAAPSDTLHVGEGAQLSALLTDGEGRAVSDAALRWTSSDSTVVRVSATGLATGLRAGVADVAAASGRGRATLRVVVLRVPAAPPEVPGPVPAPPLTAGAGDGSYAIHVSWVGAPDARASTLVDAVVARWRRAITGDLPDVALSMEAGDCYDGQPASRETVDDLVVYVRVIAIDGAAGTLARAGPCMVRGGRGLPIVGVIELDSADLSRSASTVQSVLTHEFGHVLGIGTLWEYKGLLHGKDSGDPLFLGATAHEAYATLGGGALAPVENGGGEGTKHGHWRESVFRTELMTGWIGAGGNPMSTMTIASLRDLGYAVDLRAADAYVLPSRSGASPRIEGVAGERIVDELILPKFVVDERGRSRRIR